LIKSGIKKYTFDMIDFLIVILMMFMMMVAMLVLVSIILEYLKNQKYPQVLLQVAFIKCRNIRRGHC